MHLQTLSISAWTKIKPGIATSCITRAYNIGLFCGPDYNVAFYGLALRYCDLQHFNAFACIIQPLVNVIMKH
jgi:hypothetical protein